MAKIAKQKYTMVDVDSIEPHPDNPNEGDVGAISVSIKRNDFYGAVLVQESTRLILAGEFRWLAAKAEGLKKLPVLMLDCDKRAALRILFADNRHRDLASTNEPKLAEGLSDLLEDEGTLAGTGYDNEDLNAILARLEADVGVSGDGGSGTGADGKTTCPKCGYEFKVKGGEDGAVGGS